MNNIDNKKELITDDKNKISATNENKSFLLGNGSKRKKSDFYGNKKFNRPIPEFEERVIEISRVTNVVKGGRRFSFSVLVVIGDKKGRVGYGQGKSKEIPEAIKKAIRSAKKKLIRIPIVNEITIPHIIEAKFVSSKVLLKPANKGSGIIASGAIRPVVELAGYHDIVTKSLRSSNKKNVVKATIKALSLLRNKKEILELKSK